MKAIRRFSVRPVLPEPLRPLGELAGNLRWSWHAGTRELFRTLDPAAWRESGGDPVRTLTEAAPERCVEAAADPDFVRRVDAAVRELRRYLEEPRWYQGQDGELPAAVAYFSPEFGLAGTLPQYSGGLGILAGDHLKAGSDLGVPLIGVGLLYRHGYFRQSLGADGWQREEYPVFEPEGTALRLLRETARASDQTPPRPVRVGLRLPEGRSLVAQVWLAQVGRVPLLLLDSDVDANAPAERQVTDRLYGGGSEHRLLQEMLLGVGGVRAVRAYCAVTGHPSPEVFHTNEGHAGFSGLERVRELLADGGDTRAWASATGSCPDAASDAQPDDAEQPPADSAEFDAAVEAVRAGALFTTHTPVPAGIDRFDRGTVARYFGAEGELPGVEVEDVLRLGAEEYPGGDPGVFNMAVMGLRLAQRANGVSTLHGEVARRMFVGLWPGFEPEEVPLASVTNGVHAPTWTASEVPADGAALGALDETGLWRMRRTLRERLVEDVRRRLHRSWRARGAAHAELAWIDGVFDPEVLTIGFARRVPSYKRLTLMLQDRDRLAELLLHPTRPVQIVVAGKAHPADDGGKGLIRELVRFADDPRVRHRMVFLPDYGMSMAQTLYPGCDVWLNNPIRPLEACGTSGMKAALNGCLNLSVRDGWWDEWYEPEFGWALPTADGAAEEDPERRDALEAAALYDLLAEQVAPCFYARESPEGTGDGGAEVPKRWVAKVRETLGRLGPRVNAERMVQEYVTGLYAPAARAHRELTPGVARELSAWKRRLRAEWAEVAVERVESEGDSVGDETLELGASLALRARVALGGLDPADVEVQAVAGRVDESDVVMWAGARSHPLKRSGGRDVEGRWLFEGRLPLDRTGSFGYTVRVLPAHRLLCGAAEMGLVAVASGDAGVSPEAGVLLR
ncbi:alpha-glucan family phosphorylase [Streptomyces xiaopingdaonensis]|uniref:alpha-glucan family phosphorylase n=1 Tax=Streptomyces xiaopingdaonensis TaxID=1565415 RepID=UPI0002FFAFE3|nr:alpha-glucan family phosphorylase [Streptomyces xiaopingdaonensis]